MLQRAPQLHQHCDQGLRVVVNDLVVLLVEAGSQVLLSSGQAHSVCNTLSQRTCRGEILSAMA